MLIKILLSDEEMAMLKINYKLSNKIIFHKIINYIVINYFKK